VSTNDITGDKLQSKELSPEGKANWDLIFGTKQDTVVEAPQEEAEVKQD
jgi:hypothetical protein